MDKRKLGSQTTISLMAQYFPTYKAALENKEIDRKLTKRRI